MRGQEEAKKAPGCDLNRGVDGGTITMLGVGTWIWRENQEFGFGI